MELLPELQRQRRLGGTPPASWLAGVRQLLLLMD
jgi:hypothetical protein